MKRTNLEPTPIPQNLQIASDLYRFLSPKAGLRMVSILGERNYRYWLLLEATTQVVQLCERFPRIPTIFINKRQFVFSVWIKWANGLEECVYVPEKKSELKKTNDEKLIPINWEKVEAYCTKNNLNYRFVIEDDLKPFKMLINNYKRIIPFVQRAYLNEDPDLSLKIEEKIIQLSVGTLGELESYFNLKDSGDLDAQAFRLIYEGRLTAPLNETKVSRTLVLRPSSTARVL